MITRLTRVRCDVCPAKREVEPGSYPSDWVRVRAKPAGHKKPVTLDLCPAHVSSSARCKVDGCVLRPDGDHRMCAAHHKRQVRGEPLGGVIIPRNGAHAALLRNAIAYADAVTTRQRELATARLVASARYFRSLAKR